MNGQFPIFVGLRFFTSGSRNRLASFISVLAISGLVLGIAMLIVVLSVMNGFDREMRTQVLGVIPHIQLFGRPAIDDHKGFERWQQASIQLLKHPAVRSITPFTQVPGIINFRGKTEAVQLRGVSRSHLTLESGPLAEQLDDFESITDSEIILPRFLADKLGIKPGQKLAFISPHGGQRGELSAQTILPVVRVFILAGLFDTHTAVDAHLGIVSLGAASDMVGLEAQEQEASGMALMPAAQGLRVTVKDIFSAREVAFQLLAQLPPGYRFVDWVQTHGNLYQAIQMSRKLVGLLVFLIIAIAAFNVIAMLVMTVINKRPDIAILKTQGASARTIMGIFLIQGALIGLLGSLLGAGLGCLGAWFVSDVVTWLQGVLNVQFLNLNIYPIDYVPSDLRLADVGKVVMIALVLNLLATLYPAWQAARVRPAQVLRYE